jgi:malic enzyme
LECTIVQANTWRNDNTVFASGSPFAPEINEGKTDTPEQENNVFIFRLWDWRYSRPKQKS